MGKASKGGAGALVVRLDAGGKDVIARAARLRGISAGEYARQVTVAQAAREVAAADQNVIVMTPDEQLAFWTALGAPVELTAAQQRLGRLMRGEE